MAQSITTVCEADIYRTLNKEGVKHVASMRLGAMFMRWSPKRRIGLSSLRNLPACHAKWFAIVYFWILLLVTYRRFPAV
jgi:hypothetical protein